MSDTDERPGLRAVDAVADKILGPRTSPAPTPIAEAITVTLRRATVVSIALVFGGPETRHAVERMIARDWR